MSFVHSSWPNCVVQMLSYHDEAPEYAGMHGSGFFVQRQGRVFLLTARHCLGKLGEDLTKVAANLMIPIYPPDGSRPLKAEDYVGFQSVGRAYTTENLDSYLGDKAGDLDVVALEVRHDRPTVISALLPRCVSLPPDGQWFLKAVARLPEGAIPLLARGFPKFGLDSSIDYEAKHIVMQEAILAGLHSGIGAHPHQQKMTCLPETPIADGDGMSGGPVYMRKSANEHLLVGMIQNGKLPTIHFATVDLLTEAVQRCVNPT